MMIRSQMGLNGPIGPPGSLSGPGPGPVGQQPQIGPGPAPLINNPMMLHGAPGMHVRLYLILSVSSYIFLTTFFFFLLRRCIDSV